MSILAERLLALHDALGQSDIPHAFGGAIALAYCTHEPRGTRDLDVNVFTGIDRAEEVFGAMPAGVRVSATQRRSAAREGQVRLWWDDTPIDVFFDTHEFYRDVAARVRTVPFGGRSIPVIDCLALTVFKALYNRTKDWADIEAIVEAGAVEHEDVLTSLARLVETNDPAFVRFSALAP